MRVLRFMMVSAFHYLFYKGSRISDQVYQPLLHAMPQVKMADFQTPINNDTILIGHSFGGTLALLQAMRHPDKVKGIVLLNSHFNHRWKMPYPGISINAISQIPVLTLLSGKDTQLPIHKALDDFWLAQEQRKHNRYFSLDHDGDHFSYFNSSLQETCEAIQEMTERIETGTVARLLERQSPLEKRYALDIYNLTQHAIITSNSQNLLDALFSVLPAFQCLWKIMHWTWFLSSKPTPVSHFIHVDDTHILWKGSPDDCTRIRQMMQAWTGNKQAFSLVRIILPTLHPSILIWLSLLLVPIRHHNTLYIPVLQLPINKNTTYYKIPHPHQVFSTSSL